MEQEYSNKKYNALKLPKQLNKEKERKDSPKKEQWQQLSLELEPKEYYEIEYDSGPFPGVGRFVSKSQKIEPVVRDEVRELFGRMREIARNYSADFYFSNRFYDKRVQWENARVFYHQGIFMQDFEDTYEDVAVYSSYFPNYQRMGYEQLRTYFTWRTKVRRGLVEKTSLSYAYLYLYELITNIGVKNPMDGLEQLMFFWQEYRELDSDINSHVIRWIKDYHIYYELPHSFREFVEGVGLQEFYPELAQDDRFELFYHSSKYDIRKSAFFTEEKEPLIRESFELVMAQISAILSAQGISLEDTIFEPIRSARSWQPFQDSLFFPWKSETKRKVMISQREVYLCSGSSWTCSNVMPTERGKKLLGYIFKQTESVLRKLTGYRYKLRTDLSTVTHEAVQLLENQGFPLEELITETVTKVYREATKTVVKVDTRRLQKIREEAYVTQEKLTVPEEEEYVETFTQNTRTNTQGLDDWNIGNKDVLKRAETKEKVTKESEAQERNPKTTQLQETESKEPEQITADPWEEFGKSLTEPEWQALTLLFSGALGLKEFADQHGMMQEVLIDNINEKAMDTIGDTLLDEAFTLYEDYIEEVRKLVLK